MEDLIKFNKSNYKKFELVWWNRSCKKGDDYKSVDLGCDNVLYILSDEELKEGDYVYESSLSDEKVHKIYNRNDKLVFFRFRNVPIFIDKDLNSAKKIIATSDEDLAIVIDIPLITTDALIDLGINLSLGEVKSKFESKLEQRFNIYLEYIKFKNVHGPKEQWDWNWDYKLKDNIIEKFIYKLEEEYDEASLLKEAKEIIQFLKAYGQINPVKRVLYPEGSHKDFIDKAHKWLNKANKYV